MAWEEIYSREASGADSEKRGKILKGCGYCNTE